MKKMILLFGLGLCGVIANAQSIGIGPEIGLNLSNLSDVYNGDHSTSSVRPGLKVGGIVDIGLTRMFSIQPGIFYTQKGAQENDFSSLYNHNTTTTHQVKYDYRIDYLEVPLNFQVSFGHRRFGRVFVGAGPYMAFALGGKVTNKNATTVTNNGGSTVVSDRRSSYNLQIGNDANTDDIKPADAGVNLNVGYEFPHGLLLRANYGQGIANILPGVDENNALRNWGFGFSVGYLLGH